MAIQAQPSRIPEPFAASGTKNTIPATNATPSASQAASWASGFPPECSLPISAGGCPVPRNDVNGALHQISQDYAFRQDGGVWAWSAQADYDISRMVRGSDGKLYFSKAQSGPGTAAGAQDPTADSGTYWTPVPTDDADVVHIAGAETITGDKTFRNQRNPGTGYASNIRIADAVVEATDAAVPDDPRWLQVNFVDKTTVLRFGVVETQLPYTGQDDKTAIMIGAGDFTFAGKTYPLSRLYVRSFSNGLRFAEASNFVANTGTPRLASQNSGAEKGTAPSTPQHSYVIFGDKNFIGSSFSASSWLGCIDCRLSESNNVTIAVRACKSVAGDSSTFSGIQLQMNDSGTKRLVPEEDGVLDLGAGDLRFKQIYATSATISTSDARLKTEPQEVPDEVLDAWGDCGFVQFQMLDAVAEKGADKARLHSGMIAQRIAEAFSARGLDASRYGLFCHDAWDAEPEERDEHGNLVSKAREAGDCYSLRYEEALCMEAAYQRRRADRAEARLAALEERFASIEAKLNS